MNQLNESSSHSSRSFGKTILAGLVVLVAGFLVISLVVKLILAIALPILLILAVVAVVWALKVLL